MKIFVFWFQFDWTLFPRVPIVNKSGGDNGSAPVRQQAITWISVDKDAWYHMASHHFVVSSVPADGLAPLGARLSAGTVMTKFDVAI